MQPVPPPLPLHAQTPTVASKVRGLPPGARPSEVWRSAACTLLRLNPKECDALGLVFESDDVDDERRVLILDLLALAGTFEAQVVMRRLLALAIARRDNRMFTTFAQRLGFVEHPDGPTLRFLMSVYAESRGEPSDIRGACAYALGASAGQADAAGDGDAAIRASEVLRRDLLAASTTPEKTGLIVALGNAGLSVDASLLLRFARDEDPHVRAAAALSLRKFSSRDAKAQLLKMLTDVDRKVSQGALVALSEQKLAEDELERLADLVLGGCTALALDGRILRLVAGQKVRTVGAARPGAIESALRLLLGRVEAAVEATSGSPERRPGEVAPPPLRSGQAPATRFSSTEIDERFASFPSAPPPFRVAASKAVSLPSPPEKLEVEPDAPPTILRRGAVESGLHPRVTATAEQMRERLRSLGLDPDAPARLPLPPRRANGAQASARPLTETVLASTQRGVPALHPAAIVRRR
jgi:HEAT repeat protein